MRCNYQPFWKMETITAHLGQKQTCTTLSALLTCFARSLVEQGCSKRQFYTLKQILETARLTDVSKKAGNMI